jgi:polysaccharide export outer membrane protein
MKKSNPFFRKELLIVTILLVFLAGCVSQKKIKYLQQDPDKDSVFLFQMNKAAQYRVQASDNLYISIKSLSERANELFNQQMESSGMTSDASIYLNSYTVSRDGNINFPVIGNVYVQDMTVEEIMNKLQTLVSEYLKETIVIVKLVNYNLTILGEVQKPGEYKIYQDKITIFEGDRDGRRLYGFRKPGAGGPDPANRKGIGGPLPQPQQRQHPFFPLFLSET